MTLLGTSSMTLCLYPPAFTENLNFPIFVVRFKDNYMSSASNVLFYYGIIWLELLTIFLGHLHFFFSFCIPILLFKFAHIRCFCLFLIFSNFPQMHTIYMAGLSSVLCNEKPPKITVPKLLLKMHLKISEHIYTQTSKLASLHFASGLHQTASAELYHTQFFCDSNFNSKKLLI